MPFDADDAPTPQPEQEYEGLDLDRYKAWWREHVDGYQSPRVQHFRDEEYYDGDVKGTGEGQWESTQLEKLKLRKQPPSVFNLIKRKINAIAGVEQRSRSEPRALPRTPKDQYAAEITTDALRFIKEQTRWETIKADAFLEALKIGYAAVEINGAEDCVPVTPIDWKDFFFDPRSRRPDFSDARYLGIAKWLDADVAEETYAPEAPEPELPPPPQSGDPNEVEQWQALTQQILAQHEQEEARRQKIVDALKATGEGSGSTDLTDVDHDDRPAAIFTDRKRKRIFVVDMWHRDPKKGWFRCVFTGAGKLFTEAATLIEKDQWGRKQPTHPIKAFSLYVSKDLWRYGEVRGMRSPQDEVNMRRSKALHLLTTNQIINRIGNYGPDGNRETLRSEAARPDGIMEVQDVDQFRLEKNLDLASGQQQLGAEARQFMEFEGPNPQLQGIQGQASSGRAVLALQQAGLGQLGPIFDRFHDWEDRCYRSMWARVQQFWTAPMYVRVTDDKNAARFAAVNGAPSLDEQGQPKPRQQPPMAGVPSPAPQGPPNGMGGGAMATPGRLPGSMPGAPAQMQGQMRGLGDNGGPPIDPNEFETGPMLAELDMDIIIDRAPEAATLQAEQFEELGKLVQAGILPPGPETARLIITASALPTKTELLDMLDKMGQAPNPKDQAQKAMFIAQLKELEAKVAGIVATTNKTKAETAKTVAGIPHVMAQTNKTGAEARIANTQATIGELSVGLPLDVAPPQAAPPPDLFGPSDLGPGSPNIDPLAAGAPSGANGLPPQQANGPPPY